MAHAQQRSACFRACSADEFHGGARVFGIQTRRRLISENKFRRARERTRNRDTLLLADTHAFHPGVGVRDSKARKQCGRPRPMLVFMNGGEHQRREDILKCAESMEEIERLEDHPDRAPAECVTRGAAQFVNVRAGHFDDSFIGIAQPGDQLKQRALSRPRSAGQEELLSRGDGEVGKIENIAEGAGIPLFVAELQTGNEECRCGVHTCSSVRVMTRCRFASKSRVCWEFIIRRRGFFAQADFVGGARAAAIASECEGGGFAQVVCLPTGTRAQPDTARIAVAVGAFVVETKRRQASQS